MEVKPFYLSGIGAVLLIAALDALQIAFDNASEMTDNAEAKFIVSQLTDAMAPAQHLKQSLTDFKNSF